MQLQKMVKESRTVKLKMLKRGFEILAKLEEIALTLKNTSEREEGEH